MYDVKLLLKDAGTVTSSGYGEVESAAKVLNLGDGLVRGNLILDISAMTINDADEKYEIPVRPQTAYGRSAVNILKKLISSEGCRQLQLRMLNQITGQVQ